MGMFDEFKVEEGNIQNIPFDPLGYQGKDLDCSLDRYTISKEGVLSCIDRNIEFSKFTGAINIYPVSDGPWLDYYLYFESNQLVFVMCYDEELFISDEYRRNFFKEAIKSVQ